MSMEIPPRDPWLAPDCGWSPRGRRRTARPSSSAPRLSDSCSRSRRPLPTATAHRAPGRADSMPRSFLVKKHQSSKKPKYGGLSSEAEEARCDMHKDPPPQSYILTQHFCPVPSPHLQQRPQPLSSPLRGERLQPPHSTNSSPFIFSGYSSEANRASPTDACETVEPCAKVNLEIQCVTGGYRRMESILPPSLPLLALFPVVPPSSGSRENFECLNCHEGHLSFSGLAKHKQLQCDWRSKKSFSCKYCEKEYVSLGALKMHIRTHTLPCVCKLCGKAFSRPWLLQGHIRTHTGEKPFSCFHCSRAFADRSNLRAHLQTHSEVKKYQCSSCFKTFSRVSLLAKHQEAGCPVS